MANIPDLWQLGKAYLSGEVGNKVRNFIELVHNLSQQIFALRWRQVFLASVVMLTSNIS